MEKKFEEAIRAKDRFPFRGSCTVEDLYDLSLTNLDSVYKTLRKQQKIQEEDSLLSQKSKEDERVNRQIEIVKHIVGVKQAENAARRDATEKKARASRLKEILAAKQDAALNDLSEEDIKKQIAELEG